MNSSTRPSRFSSRSLFFGVLQVLLVILIPTALVYWIYPTLTLHLLLVWGGLVLVVSLLRVLTSRH